MGKKEKIRKKLGTESLAIWQVGVDSDRIWRYGDEKKGRRWRK